MPRPTIGARAMTPAERQARRRAKLEDEAEAAYRAQRNAHDEYDRANEMADKASEDLARHADRLHTAVMAAVRNEPHEDLSELFAENDRLLARMKKTAKARHEAHCRHRGAWDRTFTLDGRIERARRKEETANASVSK